MTAIHPTAIISESAVLGENVRIGAYAVIGEHVKIGNGVTVSPHVVIDGRTDIGEGSTIYPFASLGSAPQDLKYKGEESTLVVGRNNIIREHVTMNPGTAGGTMETRTGDNCLFMVGVHIAHDCLIGNSVIMANNATLGGHVTVGDYAFIGGLAAVHQFVRIGNHAVVGGMSGVESDIIPYGRVKGERAFLAGLNLIGLERRGFTKDQMKMLQRAFNHLFGEEGTFEERLDSLTSEFKDEALVTELVAFARQKTRFSLCQPPRREK